MTLFPPSEELTAQNYLANSTLPSSLEDNSITFACSPLPSMPSRAHISDSLGSMDHTRSPTLADDSKFLAKLKHDYAHIVAERTVPSPISLIKETGRAESICPTVQPIRPSERSRYDRGIVIEDVVGPWKFGPLETLSASEHEVESRRIQVCTPWHCHVHPEGQPYYSLKDPSKRFVYLTEANVAELPTRFKLEHFINTLEEKASSLNVGLQIPANAEVCLEIGDDETWSYYMADVKNRCVFWLDSIDLSGCLGVFGIESKDQFKHILAFEFWVHIEHFPISHRQHLEGLEDEVTQILRFMTIDVMTSEDSTVPIEPAELQSFVKSLKVLQDSPEGSSSSCTLFCLARMMCIISNDRFYNLHGFHGARLSVFQSIRGNPPAQAKHSVLLKCLSPVLFYAPTKYLWRIERLHVDGIIRQNLWEEFSSRLDSDLCGIILLSGVILVANAAMLTGPDILSRSAPALWPTAAETANRISIVASLGGILIGLQLKVQGIRVNSKRHGGKMSHLINYLSTGTGTHRRESFAVYLSLPYAMLMWGVMAFAISVAIYCFDVTNGTPGLVSQILLAVFWFFTMVSVFWSFLTSWRLADSSHLTDVIKKAGQPKPRGIRKEIRVLKNAYRAESTSDLSFVEKAGEY